MNATHTPGPWQAINWTCHAPTTVVVDDFTVVTKKRVIAECDKTADARLIAAAPELLKCLAYALEMLEVDRVTLRQCHTSPDGRIDPHDAEMCDEMDAVASRFRAAIAKATGAAA